MLDKQYDTQRGNGASDRFQTIYEALRDRICLLEYHPGTRLSEDQLAREFGVSRTPIRRVLGRLEAQGLVQTRPGVGNFVTELRDDALVQCYELRTELTVLMSRLGTTEDVEALANAFQDILTRGKEFEREPVVTDFARLNAEYYSLLMQLSDNEPFREISKHLYFVTSRNWVNSIPQMDLSEEVSEFLREVSEVARAVETGDVRAASQIHASYLSMSVKRILMRAD